MGIAGHRGGLSRWACPPPGIGNGCKQGGVGGDGAGRSQPAPRKSPTSAGVARSQPTSRAGAGAGAGTNGAALPDPCARPLLQPGRKAEEPGGEGGSSSGCRRNLPAWLPRRAASRKRGASQRRLSPCPRRWAQCAGRSRWEPQRRVLGNPEEPWRPRHPHPPPPPVPARTPFPARRSGAKTPRRRALPPRRCRWGWGRDRLSPGSYAGAHPCPLSRKRHLAAFGDCTERGPRGGGRGRGPVGRLLRAGGRGADPCVRRAGGGGVRFPRQPGMARGCSARGP